ncbi:MAG: ARPP-1 family domain-containing protein [Stellaceae bacterium]
MFAQAGDIVKGGQQDRALTASLLLPPRSGRTRLAVFCVEHGRLSKCRARGDCAERLTCRNIPRISA